MHPVSMTELAGKRILLGLTGGIAAYKAGELARLFVRSGADVQVVMTRAACGFVTPATMQALSGKPAYTDMWDGRIPNNMGHIELSRDRDLIVVAPASADFMAKLANGLADDLLSALCLARRSPLAVAPAMNVEMWNHPATQRNAAQLRADGVAILGPASGDQACGETGMGRMLEAAEIYAQAVPPPSPKGSAPFRGRGSRATASSSRQARPTNRSTPCVESRTSLRARWVTRWRRRRPRRERRAPWYQAETHCRRPRQATGSMSRPPGR